MLLTGASYHRRVHRLLVVILVLVACSGPPAGTPTTDASPSTVASTTTPASTTTTVPSSSGQDRPVELLGDPAPGAPLLVLLHGFGDSGAAMAAAWAPLALDAGMVVVAPDGTEVQGRRFWNASSACCDFTGTGVDDVAYLADMIEQTRADHDLGTVTVLGFSNGAFMAHRLACDRAGVVDAIVAIAGALDAEIERCDPDGTVRVLTIHGDADPVVRYEGVASGDAPPPLGSGHPSAADTIGHWASELGCGAGAEGPGLDLEVGGEDETTSLVFGGCPSGSAAELWTVRGADHSIAFSGDGRRIVLDWVSR